jgi:large subunit ribosomal protein L31e
MADDIEQTAITLKQQKTPKPVEKKPAEEEKAEGVQGITPQKAKVEGKKEAPKPKEEKKEKPKREIILERVYIVPFTKAFAKPRIKRGNVAARLLRAFAAKHMKTDLKNVKIANDVNSVINARGCRKPPKKIAIRVSKDKEGIVEVALKK